MPNETFRGVWWLPKASTQGIVEDLSFTHEDGCRLELRGYLGGVEHALEALAEARVHSYPIVEGRVGGRQPVLLDDCWVVGSRVGQGEATQVLLSPTALA